MRGLVLLSLTVGGGLMGMQTALRWGAELAPSLAGSSGLNLTGGLFLLPVLLTGALCGMFLGNLLWPRRY